MLSSNELSFYLTLVAELFSFYPTRRMLLSLLSLLGMEVGSVFISIIVNMKIVINMSPNYQKWSKNGVLIGSIYNFLINMY